MELKILTSSRVRVKVRESHQKPIISCFCAAARSFRNLKNTPHTTSQNWWKATISASTGQDRQQCARAHQEQQDERQQSTIAQEHRLSHTRSVFRQQTTAKLGQ